MHISEAVSDVAGGRSAGIPIDAGEERSDSGHQGETRTGRGLRDGE